MPRWSDNSFARIACLFAFAVLISVPTSYASVVNINPNLYTGRYFIPGFTAPAPGPSSVDLPAGTYSIDNGTSAGGSAFSFMVDSAGQVTTSSPSASASGNTLTFNNTPVTISPGNYTGRYFLTSHLPTAFTGLQNLTLIPGLVYGVDDGTEIGGSEFLFTVDSAGRVSTTSAAATGAGSTLKFNNATIVINPGNYIGSYFLSSYEPAKFNGQQTFVLLPGLSYGIDTGAHVSGSEFIFTVDGNGQVLTTSPAATASGNTLFFNNASITINPASYTGQYYVTAFLRTILTGQQTIVLVPGLVYGVDNGSFAGNSNFLFTVDASGQVTTSSSAAVGVSSMLTFLNVSIHVDPTTYAGTYVVGGYSGLTGVTDLVLIPSLLTAVGAGNQTGYFTPSLTAVVPSTVLTFTLSVSQQGFLSSSNQQISAFVGSGAISTAGMGNSFSVQITNALRFVGGNNAQAKTLLLNLVSRLNTMAANGQITPLVRDTLAAQINALISSLG